MTPKTLEKRTRTAALKSLALIAELAAKHQVQLDSGEVPDAGFTASVTKYEENRVKLMILAALAEDGGDASSEEPAGELAVQREDLDLLVAALQEFVPGLSTSPDSPLGRFRAVLARQVAEEEPDGA